MEVNTYRLVFDFENMFCILFGMKKIANILFDKSKDISELYNVCDYNTIIPGIPTLIVGWENVKKKYPDKSIIGWQIDSLTYWTFGKREKRDRYERDITEFKKIALKQLKTQIHYRFYDVLTADSIDKLIFGNLMFSEENTIYQTRDMIYIYNNHEKTVFGMSKSDFTYGKFSVKKMFESMSELNSESTHFVTNDVPFELKNQLSGSKYLIPYLYS